MIPLLLAAALPALALAAPPAPAAPAASAELGALERIFDLDAAVAVALKNDSRLLSADQDRTIAQQRLTESKLAFLPEFGLQAAASKFDSRYPTAFPPELGSVLGFPRGSAFNPTGSENIYSGRGYMSFPLYEGGRSVNTLRMAQAAVQQAQSNYETVKMDVVLAAKEAFYRFLLAQERLAAASETARAAQSLASAMSLNPWDRIEAEGLGEKSRQWEAQALRDTDLRRLDFLKALNLELTTPFKVAGRLEPQSVEADAQKAALWAMDLRPELQAVKFKAVMDALAVSLALSRRYPTVSLAGDYDFTDQHFPLLNNNWNVGIGIKLPFTYDVLTKFRQKRAEQRQGVLERAALQDQVRMEVTRGCQQMDYWKQEAGARHERYRSVAGIYEKAAPGTPASLAKLKALMTVNEMRLSYLDSLTESALARARLERAVGRDLAP